MRSVTSCFNSTLYTKTMGRFWPLWTLYGIIWMFAIPLRLLTQYFDYTRYGSGVTTPENYLLKLAQEIPDALTVGVMLSGGFAILSAMAVFGYLYNSRSACMMHALPMRRESLFFTNYLAGLSFLLLPQLAMAAFAAAVEMALLPSALWGTALSALGTWLWAQSATALFFFSFASFCAMFTGHLLALPAFYGILNILVIGVTALVTGLMSEFFYGFTDELVGGRLVEYCTPAYALATACYWDNGLLAAPGVVAAYAGAGVVIAGLALLVYRYRHVESAGDVVAIPLVRPIFRYGVSFCSGLCFGVAMAYFFGWNSQTVPLTLSVVFWAVVGCFAAEMLLKKSFRVFGHWKGAVAMTGVMLLLCAACVLDLFGVVERVPQPGDVASVSANGNIGMPYDSGTGNWQNITDPAKLEKMIALHQAIVDDRSRVDQDSDGYENGDDSIYFYVDYTLDNGTHLRRRYSGVPVFRSETELAGSVTQAAQALLDDRELVAMAYGFPAMTQVQPTEAYLSGVTYGTGTQNWNEQALDGAAGEDLNSLWGAVQQDFAEGTLGVSYLFDDEERQENTFRTDLRLTFLTERKGTESAAYYQDLSITLTPNAAHTLSWLTEMSNLGSSYWLITQDGEPFPGAVQTP